MNKLDMTTPTRQSMRGLVLIFLMTIRQSARALWPLLVVYFVKNNAIQHKGLIWIAVIVIMILLLTHTILYFLNFYFYLKAGEFVVKTGYLSKKVLSVPLERIQSVNTKQNLLQQLLNVVSLEIDTAGSVGKELKIHALELDFARELQNYLQSEKKITREQADEEEITTVESSERMVLNLTPIDLLKIGISENHIKTAMIILAFGSQLIQPLKDVFQEKADAYSSQFLEFVSNSGFLLITFAIIFFLLISILFSLFRTVLKYFDFKLLQKEDNYRIESGLINKRNVIVPKNKVQEINWETGPLKQIFGIYHLTFKQAVSGRQNKKNQQLVDVPGCLTSHLELLQTDLFGVDTISQRDKMHTNSYYFRRLWLLSGIIPVLLSAPFLYSNWMYWTGALLWLALTAGYSYLTLKKRYFQINEEQIRVSKGAIAHKWEQMELYKIQSVQFRQTIFQKRRALASLKLMNASGNLTLPYIDENVARNIYNYLLYHTEVSKRKWM